MSAPAKHKTAIEWTHLPGFVGATWNPLLGCKVVSPGCANCYAMRLAGTRLKHHPRYAGLTDPSKAGPVWNGIVADESEDEWIKPRGWRSPHAIFVCDMSDLFYEGHSDEQIGEVFKAARAGPRHIFMILTKRARRMRAFMAKQYPVPLPNVWLGVSAEDQSRADERIPALLATPAAVRFVSAEPLLGIINLHVIGLLSRIGIHSNRGFVDALTGETEHPELRGKPHAAPSLPRLDWVIVGGESGPGARPVHPDWARSIRDQCQAAGVPFFFKQWGEYFPAELTRAGKDGEVWRKRNDGGESWAFDELGQKSPAQFVFDRVGKKAAGAMLDGREWRETP